MKLSFDIKLVKLYLWLELGYFFLGLFTALGSYPGRFFPVAFNNLWAGVYVTVLNFILFEHTVPFVLKKRKTIISSVLLGILLLFVYMLLYSYGSYLWRMLGIQLRVYTALKVFYSLDHLLQNQMAYSIGSVFFFGI